MTTERKDRVGYFRFLGAAFTHSLVSMLRQKRIVLAAAVCLVPVAVPPLVAFFDPAEVAQRGSRIFVFLVEHLYLDTLAPLLALFYGCMLVGEDVELQTIPYLLTRPIPRSSIVIGRFASYVLVTSVILLASVALLFIACIALGTFALEPENLRLLADYLLICFAAVTAYGALALFLGSASRHPVIIGIAFIFGWQRFALLIPGAVDFLTIDKYLWSLLPPMATQRSNPVIRNALMEYQKEMLLFSATKAAIALLVITVAFAALTCIILRRREYSGARALGA
jgi:ABC-2 type transport system permease protein